MTEIGKKRPLDQIETVEETAKKKLKPSFTFEPSKTFAGVSKNFTPWLTKDTEKYTFDSKTTFTFGSNEKKQDANWLKPADNPFNFGKSEPKQKDEEEPAKPKKSRTSSAFNYRETEGIYM